ncbi:retinaldehyde-binding protein 1-like [Battus philenor]|uniref:retinaldehyde-binding protein 1-like n=1 Tax=Battus philenor TaxID=42288 RepID=UPI0035CF8F49
MNSPLNNELLEYHPDTVEYIRKLYNLHRPGRMTEAVNILEEWVKKQDHFTKKDFSRFYLETTIISCKGSMERAKTQIDKICTFRNLMPQFFKKFNPKEEAGNLFDITIPVILPKMTEDNYRIFFVKLCDTPFEASQIMDYYKHCISIGEYLKANDYLNGFMVVSDFRDMSVMDLITKLNPMELKQAITIYIEGFGMRLKGIHILTTSKFIDSLITLLRQILSEKLSKRIFVHKTVESLFENIPKDILPAEYGGKEISLKEVHEKWLEILSSKKHLDYLDEQYTARTDESRRKAMQFNEQYAGVPGTFRTLTFD